MMYQELFLQKATYAEINLYQILLIHRILISLYIERVI